MASHDSLTMIGGDGKLLPSLATSWIRISPTCVEFELRRNVFFHNGEVFNSIAVEKTLKAQTDPKNNSPTGLAILSPISQVEIMDDYKVRIHTSFPDSMLPWRLTLFSSIVPPKLLEEKGVEVFKDHPIGTGPFIFESMEKGKEIRYKKNPDYWGNRPSIEGFKFVIMPAPYWVEALIEDKLDMVYGLHGVQAPILENRNDIVIKSRLSALSHWFLLSQNGALADKRVRLALNLAIDNHMLSKVQAQDTSVPQKCVGTEGQFGYNPDVMVHPFNQEKARELLEEAGFPNGFTMKGLVADHSASLVQMIAAYLSDINVNLDYEVIPRTVWMDKVPNARMTGKGRYSGDFAVTPVDNPIMYTGFHHYIFLMSEGPFSLLENKAYDEKFIGAMTDPIESEKKLQDLDKYVHDEALLLFTVQSSALVAARKGVEFEISNNGHMDTFTWLSLKDNRTKEIHPEWQYDYLDFETPIHPQEFKKVFEGTQHSADMFYFPPEKLSDKRLQKMVSNLNYQHQIKILQEKLRFYQIVQFLNKARDMEGILDASRFSGIANFNLRGELVLSNATFLDLFGKDIKNANLKSLFISETEWNKFRDILDIEGGFFGSINLVKSDKSILEAQAACSLRRGSSGETIGYLLILRDESEERKLKYELEKSYNEMEERVIQRTSELQKTLSEVQELKFIQDGDYYLTTLLVDPLGMNKVESNEVNVEFLVKEKKQFTFKGKDYEIGGDINVAQTIFLKGKPYTLFLNADAMGKSIQGAGGVLVLGSLFRAIVERTRISPIEKEYYPERWLKNAINEIHLVFESFNCSMLVSLIVGLIDDRTGFMYYINAEHPWPVLFRDGKACFLDTTAGLRKLGTPNLNLNIEIKTFKLEPEDIVFVGSDGKDDILIESEDGQKKINESENLFLQIVEEAQGDMNKIHFNLLGEGELSDDLSILKITYQPILTNLSKEPDQTCLPIELTALERLFTEYPKSEVVFTKLLKSYSDSKEYSKAAHLIEKYLEYFPESKELIYKASTFHKKTRNINKSIDLGERIRLRDQCYGRNLISLADSYAYIGNTERASKLLNELLSKEPMHPKGLLLKEMIHKKAQRNL